MCFGLLLTVNAQKKPPHSKFVCMAKNIYLTCIVLFAKRGYLPSETFKIRSYYCFPYPSIKMGQIKMEKYKQLAIKMESRTLQPLQTTIYRLEHHSSVITPTGEEFCTQTQKVQHKSIHFQF